MTWLHWIAAALGVSAFLLCIPGLLGTAAQRSPLMEGRGRALVLMQVAVVVLWVSAMFLFSVADLSRS